MFVCLQNYVCLALKLSNIYLHKQQLCQEFNYLLPLLKYYCTKSKINKTVEHNSCY